jgi:hypothetical protein
MPPHHGGGRDDLDRLPPVSPDGREQYPEYGIFSRDRLEGWTGESVAMKLANDLGYDAGT